MIEPLLYLDQVRDSIADFVARRDVVACRILFEKEVRLQVLFDLQVLSDVIRDHPLLSLWCQFNETGVFILDLKLNLFGHFLWLFLHNFLLVSLLFRHISI